MKVVDNLKGIESYFLLISGNGTFPERVLFKSLCRKFDGEDTTVFYIDHPIKKQTGLNALNAIPLYSKKYQISSIIFIVDGEHIKENAAIEIRKQLESKGIGINEILPLQGAFLIKCKSGPYDILLFCIILGPEVFIEEEVARLIELKLGVKIDLSRKGEPTGRKAIKSQIRQILRKKGIDIEELVMNTGKLKLEKAFPNICAVLKKIEEKV
ncbi:hypothetical protein LCGC14_0564440 [marine sediment metagenome]|uniref:Uncharacterized protein n=1 Tax=marine sediment metagenome TaxID=412755 RepID=A0A0F9U7I1_9ZZZZ|nr:MAG: hypothetical protein Lokiarch_37190 [Candidatus Lokiarchaeum sp. GC14_75]